MKSFVNRSNYEIQKAIREILKDAKEEMKKNPNESEQIKAFCKELMEANNGIFEKYKEDSENQKNIER